MLKSSEYEAMHKKSLEEKEAFWMDYALKRIEWFKEPTQALDSSKAPFYKWFPDGEVNLCHNALDRHIAARGDQTAIAYDSAVGGKSRLISYSALLDMVSKFAGALAEMGVGRGDRVIIYMPMVPEAIVAMLACNRIGAVHSVVFGGFAAMELSVRIRDTTPKAVVTSSCGIEKGQPLEYLPIVDHAISLSGTAPSHVVVHQREELFVAEYPKQPSGGAKYVDFYQTLEKANGVSCVPLLANDPLYVLYTSGTTGKPKGILRDNTHVIPLQWTMDHFMVTKPGETFWSASDIGWVVGHSYTTFAPLVQGCTSVLYEGKPVGTPDAAAYWRVIEQYGVNTLFTAPTAVRAIRKEDPTLAQRKKHDTSSLRSIFMAGERADTDTINFFADKLSPCAIIDHWWQTETGWPMCGIQIENIGMRAGSCGRPLPGYDLHILDQDTGSVATSHGVEGALAVRMPLPPGSLTTVYNNDERCFDAYFAKFGPEWYCTGDAGYVDADGYVHVMSRTDDVINVAGHRLSSGQIEEAVCAHGEVVECVVLGAQDDLRGHVPLALVVMATGSKASPDQVSTEVVELVRERVGAVACLKHCAIVKGLPKTRSGKMLRNVLRAIADGESYTLPPTIEDPTTIDLAKTALTSLGYATAKLEVKSEAR